MVEQPTKIIFLVHKDDEHNIVFAVMPHICGTYDPQTMTSYEHVGQHGSAHQDYVAECRLATAEEYADLKLELERVGYVVDVQDYTDDTDYEVRAAELLAIT